MHKPGPKAILLAAAFLAGVLVALTKVKQQSGKVASSITSVLYPLPTAPTAAHSQPRARILCIILATDSRHSRAIKATWVHRCDRCSMYGNFEDEVASVARLPSVKPWPMLCGSILRACNAHRDAYDWVLIVNDKTFVVIDNLQKLVSTLSADQLHYLGHPMHKNGGRDFNDISTGIVLSHRLMQSFISAVPDDDACDRLAGMCDSGADCNFGRMLEILGAKVVDTSDQYGRERFAHTHLLSAAKNANMGENCCSSNVVTLAKISWEHMYLLEYLLYHVEVHKEERIFAKNISRL